MKLIPNSLADGGVHFRAFNRRSVSTETGLHLYGSASKNNHREYHHNDAHLPHLFPFYGRNHRDIESCRAEERCLRFVAKLLPGNASGQSTRHGRHPLHSTCSHPRHEFSYCPQFNQIQSNLQIRRQQTPVIALIDKRQSPK